MTHVLYLVHDLSDAAVRRRVGMLRAGGASVELAGFRRSSEPVWDIDGVPAIDLGQTRDADLKQRALKVVAAAGLLPGKLAGLRAPDVVLARNLEMLALAHRVPTRGERPRIVYESLDIHRLLLRTDAIGRIMRALERALLRRASLLVTSSPAFPREYFRPLQRVRIPILLVENKVFEPGPPPADSAPSPLPSLAGRPLTIGWFGALRCRKSLELLADFTRRMEGRVEVVLRGRPAYTEFDDFEGFVASQPHMRFLGPYRAPEDLPAIYGEVDLTWAIDFFEEGQNSRWLLPNRLYEGCRHGRVPIALAGTETARYLRERGIGLVLPEASAEAMATLFEGLDRDRMLRLGEAVAATDASQFVSGRPDCAALVRAIEGSELGEELGADMGSDPPAPARAGGE